MPEPIYEFLTTKIFNEYGLAIVVLCTLSIGLWRKLEKVEKATSNKIVSTLEKTISALETNSKIIYAYMITKGFIAKEDDNNV